MRADHDDPTPAVDAERRQTARDTSQNASNATTGTAVKPTACSQANARPRICLGASSEIYVPIVTSSTPMPTPATKRQKFRPPAVS